MQDLPHKLYLTQQVNELNRIAIEEKDIKNIKLMRHAANTVFQLIQQRWEEVKHIAIFCGVGSNAGYGYFIASLALQANFKVSVYTIGEVDKLTGGELVAYLDYIQHNGEISTLDSFSQPPYLIIDALLGTGITRNLSRDYAKAVTLINETACPVVSIDIPSGIHSDTGCVMGSAVEATVTVSFIGLKQGMFTGMAVNYCGEIIFDDLNIPENVFNQISHTSERLKKPSLPRRLRNTHKGNCGHVLVIGGDEGYSGAPRLAAEAALRTGAGLVSIATHPSHASVLNLGRFELMSHPIEDAKQLEKLIKDASVIILGTGLKQRVWGESLFEFVIDSELPMIIDADGLNLLAKFSEANPNRILTPHPKEAARLLNCTTEEILNNRFLTLRKIQTLYGGVCLLKGAGTIIDDGNKPFLNTTGNAGMATAGMGDVLSGIIGGLVAQGLSLIDATTSAVHIHGEAADLASKQGERGLLAGDLMPYIRKLVN